MIVTIDDIPITIIRKAIKNMYVRIKPVTANVIVSAPKKLSLQTIQTQLLTQKAWIHATRTRILNKNPTQHSSFLVENNQALFFLGKKYTLIIHPDKPSHQFILDDVYLHCFLQSLSQEKRSHHLNIWYKEQMQLLLPDLIQKWEPIIGVRVQAFSIKSMKTRWGSCNTVTHRISLNVYLIQKPLICLEYVLVHEMVHLLEASHNQRFYALMTQFMPNWKTYKKQLESSCHL